MMMKEGPIQEMKSRKVETFKSLSGDWEKSIICF